MQTYNEYTCGYQQDGAKVTQKETGQTPRYYQYDRMGRLVLEARITENLQNEEGRAYTYDLSGNRLKSTITDYTNNTSQMVNYMYDQNNRLTGTTTSEGQEITSYSSYFYDNNGNTTAEQTFSYTTGTQSKASAIAGRSNGNSLRVYEYNAFNQLTAYSDGSSSAQYQYNANGLRTKKTVNGQSTGFIWNGTNLAAEKMNGQIKNTYTYDITGIHSTNQNGTIGIYQKNPHGDITSIVDSSGTKLNTYNYDAFGNETINEETIANPFRYAGEYYDTESGNIYLRARYYTPSTGRFINEDPIQSGLNWYSYCASNPIKYADPSGLEIILVDIESEKDERFVKLQELTDDNLYVDLETGKVTYEKNEEPDRVISTNLVRDVINDDIICEIIPIDEESSSTAWWSDINGKVTKIQIEFNSKNTPSQWSFVSGEGYAYREKPAFMVLGHELIHALRFIRGRALYNNNYDQGYYLSGPEPGKPLMRTTKRLDELETTGIDYVKVSNNDWSTATRIEASSFYYSENSLRLEYDKVHKDDKGYVQMGRRVVY